MNTIVLIRHGETDMAGRFCGHSDPALNPAGERHVILVAEEVAKMEIASIYSSDLRRASQTATAIGQRIDVNIDYLSGLREIHFGLWEGLGWQEIEDQFPEEAGQWLREFPLRSAPEGESYSSFTARVEETIEPLLRSATCVTTAVVTHRGVMRYALTRFFGLPEPEAWTKTAAYGAIVVATGPPWDCEGLR
jgi:broad specificity phosphatase PhoE